MSEDFYTCPRCFHPISAGSRARFCPRCGLADVMAAASDHSPLEIAVDGQRFEVLERLGLGSFCNLYRCRFSDGVLGVFKIVRDAQSNPLLGNEVSVLRRLREGDPVGRYGPFLQGVETTLSLADDPPSPPRQAAILRFDREIHSPDELYTLCEVRAQFAEGLDPRHAAWIWRRILSVLGHAHSLDIVHGAVLPMHVLIEPMEHKLVLIDWCGAVTEASTNTLPPVHAGGGHFAWYKKQLAHRRPPTPLLDIALGARCMIELMGGDPVEATFPPSVDPALARYFTRCLGSTPDAKLDAWKLLNDFDILIEALWGPRTFHPLPMPPRIRR